MRWWHAHSLLTVLVRLVLLIAYVSQQWELLPFLRLRVNLLMHISEIIYQALSERCEEVLGSQLYAA